MSQHPAPVPPGAADPPRLDLQEESQQSEVARGLQDGGKANAQSRPVLLLPASDQGSLNTASSTKLGPSAVLLGEDAQQLRQGDVGRDPNQDLSLSTTPLDHFSRDTDTVKEGHIDQALPLEPGETYLQECDSGELQSTIQTHS